MMIKKIFIALFVPLSISGFDLAMGQSLIPTHNDDQGTKAIRFVQNKGQVGDQHDRPRKDVLFYGRSGDLFFHLREDGISYQQVRVDTWTTGYDKLSGTPAAESISLQKVPEQVTMQRTDIQWSGINPDYTIETGEVFPGYSNYYLPVCYEGVTDVRAYDQLTYKNIYRGIDLRWYDRDGLLEYDFLVQPGVNYQQIRWTVDGVDTLLVNEAGELVMRNALGEIREAPPLAFQEGRSVPVTWEIEDQTVGFKMGSYDRQLPLLIDPLVRVWGTYFGGGGLEYTEDCHSDGNKAVVMAGWTNSLSLIASSGASQSTFNGGLDVFIASFDLDGNRNWSTYLGGNGSDLARSCVIDGSGNVYVTGQSESDSLFATFGAHQVVRGGARDGMVAKFSSGGIRQWVTYFGGNGGDIAWGCDVDAGGNLYFAGYTYSDSLIATIGSFQTARGGWQDAFLAKMSSGGTQIWGTYFGAASTSVRATDCAVDIFGNVYMSADVSGFGLLATNGAHQGSSQGSGDALLAKFSNSGSRIWSTYYGGTASEQSMACTTDDSGYVYMCGLGTSTNGLAWGGHQNMHSGGGFDAYLVKFSSGGVRQWGTYYGGGLSDHSYDCVAGDSSTIYLTGNTASVTDISTQGSYQASMAGGTDAYLVKFNHKGVRQWATYYGGPAGELSRGCAIDDKQKVYVTGQTSSLSGIASVGAFQIANNGFNDGYLAKFGTCNASSDTITEVVCKNFTSPSGIYTWNTTGTYQDTIQNVEGCDSVLTINLTITPAPVLTSVTPATLCDSGSVVLAASASQGTIRWYTDTTSGPTSLVGTGRQFNTPVLDSTMVYYAELTDTAQCASYFVPVEATVYYSSYAAISEEACLRYTTPSGRHTVDTSGVYMDTIPNGAGCDSVLTIDLVVKTVDATATQNGMTLQANEPFGLYQWVDCNNNYSALTGNSSFNRQYQVTKNGSYAVIVTKNGCQDTSVCFNVNYVGLAPYGAKDEIRIFPNPTDGVLIIDMGRRVDQLSVELINPLGQVLQSWNDEQLARMVLELDQPPGTYLLKVNLNDQTRLFRLVKQ